MNETSDPSPSRRGAAGVRRPAVEERARPAALGPMWLAVATAAPWLGWMAWDRHYDVDPVTDRASGPYQPWQVVGCVLCLIVVAAVAARWLRAWVVVVEMSAVFTTSWSVSAATTPVHGVNLWPIGAFLIMIGMLGGSAVVAGTARIVWRRASP